MKLYLLKRIGGTDYDEYEAKLIRAKNERLARGFANNKAGDEGKIWHDKKFVSCKIVTISGEFEEIIASFNAA